MNIEEFRKAKKELLSLNEKLSEIEAEKLVELQHDTSNQNTTNGILDWYNKLLNNLETSIDIVNIDECKDWEADENLNLKHSSGSFFQVKGVRASMSTSREVGSSGWDQPILIEKNFDGGILGLVRSYINGTPHYLIEAKFEPGNYNLLQLSPTLQATFSNIEKAHGGKSPNYLDYFLDYQENKKDYIFNQWMSEDGGRLLNTIEDSSR